MRVHHLNNVNKALQILEQNNVSIVKKTFPINEYKVLYCYMLKLKLLLIFR